MIGLIVFAAAFPVATSGDRVNFNNDFFQYAARHELVRQGVFAFHSLAQRSHLVGGGYPVIGDPEDPTFNPLVLFTLALGAVTGLKWIGIVSMIFGAVSLYALTREAFGYTRYGATASALFFGLLLWLPVRLRDGNPNEVYFYFIPACLLCLYRAHLDRRYVIGLAGLFLTMLSDGKQSFFVCVAYIAVLCLCARVPGASLWAGRAAAPGALRRERSFEWIAVALGLVALFYAFRILPALELIRTGGSLGRMALWFHEPTYSPETINAYSISRMLREAVAWRGEAGLSRLTSFCIGWIPLALAAGACVLSWRRTYPWLASGALFAWLALAHNAPVDLFRAAWELPIFNAIAAPAKYFGALPLLCVCVLSGRGIDGLVQSRWTRVRVPLAVALIACGAAFLFPKVWAVSAATYTYDLPPVSADASAAFYSLRGDGLSRARLAPLEANTYVNVLRGVGTIDWYTGIPIAERAIPRDIISEDGASRPNPEYRGECFWLDDGSAVAMTFTPHAMSAQIRAETARTLVINQNYHPDWRANAGTLREWNGLLCVQVPPGSYELRLTYFSRAFALGLAISGAAVLATAGTFAFARSRRKRRARGGAVSGATP
ncbi:MAG: hypothetical protein ACKVU1_01705 [bacterium]